VIAAAIPDAILLPTDECFAQEVPEPAYDGLTCPMALSSIYTGLVTSGWLSKWGTTTGYKTSLMY
jgi:hypothetical protein